MDPLNFQLDMQELATHATRLILAAFLGTLLSFQRKPDRYRLRMIEAHALLAIAGAMFLTIIGDNFVRAVGLLGAASVVRYRYAIQNPRDASTLILSLGVGMACGSDLLVVATIGTLLILLIIQLVSLFPQVLPFASVSTREQMILRLQGRDYETMMERVTQILEELGIEYSMISFERKYRRLSDEMATEVNLHVEMSGELSLHELTNKLVDENIYRVSWHQAK